MTDVWTSCYVFLVAFVALCMVAALFPSVAALPLQAAGLSFPEVFASVTLAVRSAWRLSWHLPRLVQVLWLLDCSCLSPSVAAVPVQVACLSCFIPECCYLGCICCLMHCSCFIPKCCYYMYGCICCIMHSLRTGSLARRGTRGRGVGEEGKESLHASYCSSSILRPDFGRKIPIG